jgi:HEAT repeat protein
VPSAHVWDLIHQLYAINGPRILGPLFAGGRIRKRVRLIREIAEAKEVQAILPLSGFLLTGHSTVRVAASVAIRDLLELAQPTDYASFDVGARSCTLALYDWDETLITAVLKYPLSAVSDPFIVLALATMHWSGYVRERAVRCLSETSTDGRELPFLLLRGNDWVKQVRQAAGTAISSRLSTEYAPHFLDCWPLVDRLERSKRTDCAALVEGIRKTLHAPAAQPTLVRGLQSSQTYLRRASFALLTDAGHLPVADLLRHASRSHDVLIRQRAVALATTRLTGDEQRIELTKLTEDAAPTVRRKALTQLAQRYPEAAHPFLEAALLDPANTGRGSARFHLSKRHPERSFRATYLEALDSAVGRRLTAAIAGLGETGNASDVERVEPFLDHALPRNRRAAARALFHLDRDQLLKRAMDLLSDAGPGVSRDTMWLLRSLRSGPATAELVALLDATPHTHVARNVLTLLAHDHTWTGLAGLIRACAHPRPGLEDHCREVLCTCLSWPYEPRGDAREMEAIAAHLPRAEAMLPEDPTSQLRLWVRRAQERSAAQQ